MKRISFICLLLSFILLLSAFAGCQKADIGEDESHSESVLFSLTKKELEKYSIVVPEGCDDSVFTIADQLGEKIKDITGKKAEIRIDLVVDGSDTYYIDNYEILLGYVNRPEAKQLYTSVRENDSGYAMVGKKIIIIGRNYTALKSSYNSFFRNVLYEADSKDVLLCEGMQKITSAEYAYNELKLNGVSIEQYKIIYPSVNSLKEKSVAASMVAYILSRTPSRVALLFRAVRLLRRKNSPFFLLHSYGFVRERKHRSPRPHRYEGR